MSQVSIVSPPAVEPVSLQDLLNQMSLPVYSGDDGAAQTARLTAYLMSARQDLEKRMRRALITQRWVVRLDGFPGSSYRYERPGYAEILLPFTPFQSIEFLRYVDTFGNLQELALDISYGTNLNQPYYGYQLERGSLSQPARLLPAWAKPWPPTRKVPAQIVIQFRCGYGSPWPVSLAQGSTALTAAGYTFNSQDAPLLVGDTGQPVCIPGAGAVVGGVAQALHTFVASVDDAGNATLADAATTDVTNVQAWIGYPVPEPIKQAILFLAQYYAETGSVTNTNEPDVIDRLISPYRNLVS